MDPKDPYYIRDSGPDTTGRAVLAEETITQLNQLRRTLQIIVASLLVGVMTYGGYIFYSEEGPWTFFGPDRMDVMLGMAAICVAASLIVPMFIRPASPGNTPNVQPEMQKLLIGEPSHDFAIFAAQRIQVTTIISCALLEGAAFANIYALGDGNDLVHAVVTGILLAGMALRFPTPSRYSRRIERDVAQAQLEEPLSK